MKVLLLSPADSVHTSRFITYLRKTGVDIVFLDTRLPDGVSGIPFFPYPPRFTVLGYESPFVSRTLSWLALRRLYRKVKPDLVHLHWINQRAFDCYRACLKPLVLTAWGSDINSYFDAIPLPRISRKAMANTLNWSKFVFADSRQILDRCDVLAERKLDSGLLRFGISTDLFRPAPAAETARIKQRMRIPAEARVLLSIRGLLRLNRHDLLIRAFPEIMRSFPRPVYLVFTRISEDALYLNELRYLSEQLGIAHYVRFLDPLPHDSMPALYALADCILNFPTYDGFPVSFIEAAACGKKVISCRLPAYEGSPFEPILAMISPQDLVKTVIDELHKPPAVTASESERFRRIAIQHGDERVTIDALMNAYHAVLQP